MSDYDTIPSSVDMTTHGPEIVPWTIDVTAPVQKAGGTGVTTLSSTMVCRDTGLAVSLADTPTDAGLTITQPIRSAALEAGNHYDVYVNYVVVGAPSTTQLTEHFVVNCDS